MAAAGCEPCRAVTLTCSTFICVETRNITFNLPMDLIRQAKVYPAGHDTTYQCPRAGGAAGSVNLPGAGPGRGRPVACLALADHGPYFTTDPGSIRREELYERR